jgi:hypothetical protein
MSECDSSEPYTYYHHTQDSIGSFELEDRHPSDLSEIDPRYITGKSDEKCINRRKTDEFTYAILRREIPLCCEIKPKCILIKNYTKNSQYCYAKCLFSEHSRYDW